MRGRERGAQREGVSTLTNGGEGGKRMRRCLRDGTHRCMVQHPFGKPAAADAVIDDGWTGQGGVIDGDGWAAHFGRVRAEGRNEGSNTHNGKEEKTNG